MLSVAGAFIWTSRYNHDHNDHNDHNDHDDHNDHNDHDDHLDVDEPALVAADVLPAGAPLRGPRGQPHVLAGLHLAAAQHGHNTAALRPLELQTNILEDYAKFYNHGEDPYY